MCSLGGCYEQTLKKINRSRGTFWKEAAIENVIFIFATTEPHKVIPTIISRCQRFDFKRIPIPAIIDRLSSICKIDGISIDPEALFAIGKKADGSMRDALSLMDQVIAYGKDYI